MKPTKITRPHFPLGYVDHPVSEVSWEYVAERLTEAKNYWLCSVRPPSPRPDRQHRGRQAEARAGQANGRPHCVPRWAVYLDGKIYYDGSPETRHARNIIENPHVSLHLESGDEAIILEGESYAAEKPSAALALRLSEAYKAKYTQHGYAPELDQWDEGGLYVFTPRQCLAWTNFLEDPTKFVFEEEE